MTLFFLCFCHIHAILIVSVPQVNCVLIVIKLTALFVQEDNSNNFAIWIFSHMLLNCLICNLSNIQSLTTNWRSKQLLIITIFLFDKGSTDRDVLRWRVCCIIVCPAHTEAVIFKSFCSPATCLFSICAYVFDVSFPVLLSEFHPDFREFLNFCHFL